MRLIDADALQREYMQFHDGKRSVLVDVAPTIEPERKKGKWADRWSGDGSTWLEEICSECGVVFEDERHDYNFCPYCGADMRGEEDE